MSEIKNYFKCRARTNDGYCQLWLRNCVGKENCKQSDCAYCIKASINPNIEDSICTICTQFNFKKENYIE